MPWWAIPSNEAKEKVRAEAEKWAVASTDAALCARVGAWLLNAPHELKKGRTPLAARIPTHLTVGQAVAEIAAYSGFPAEPTVTTRYALLAADANGDGPTGGGSFLLLRDDRTFGDLAENSVLRVAPQPRPA